MGRKVEEAKKTPKQLFSSSALNHFEIEGGESCWQPGEKRPIRGSTESDVFKMFDVSLAAMTHFCTVVKSRSDQKPQNKCYCFPLLPCGFGVGECSESCLSPDILQEEMCTHPARTAINHSGCVGSPRRQDHALRIRQLFHFPEVNAQYILNGSDASAFLHSATP